MKYRIQIEIQCVDCEGTGRVLLQELSDPCDCSSCLGEGYLEMPVSLSYLKELLEDQH